MKNVILQVNDDLAWTGIWREEQKNQLCDSYTDIREQMHTRQPSHTHTPSIQQTSRRRKSRKRDAWSKLSVDVFMWDVCAWAACV